MTEEIETAQSTAVLTLMLNRYCKAHGLPHESADELLLEVLEQIEELKLHAKWIQRFITQWEAVQAEEDIAYCKRTGHRDTGRGVCADCGEFI